MVQLGMLFLVNALVFILNDENEYGHECVCEH